VNDDIHNYKFGKTVTISLPENYSETPYNVIVQNKKFGLHTLCLLDIDSKKKKFLSINEGLSFLLDIEEKRGKQATTLDTLAIGAARIGSTQQELKADFIKDLMNFKFEGPPQTLIFPGNLHFMEVKALIAFAKAPKNIKG